MPLAFETREAAPTPPPVLGAPVPRAPLTARPPAGVPLAPWRELRTRLQPHLTRCREGGAVDTERLVRWLSRGRQVERIPRQRHRRRFPLLLVLADRSEHLAPYWSDQEQLLTRLARDAAPGTLLIRPIHETRAAPGWPGGATAGPLPPPGTRLLLVGDLGCLRGADRAGERRWLAYARALQQAGVAPLALLPCAPARCPASLRAAWNALPWERPRLDDAHDASDGTEGPLERLLTLLSAAIRLEPSLVRAARLLLRAGRRDPGLESDLWQHPAIVATHSDAASWDPERANRLRARFDALSAPVRERVLRLQETWRGYLPREIWYEELLSLAPDTRALPVVRADAGLAERFYVELSERVRAGRAADLGEGARRWYRRCLSRLSDQAYAGPVAEALHRLTAFWDPQDLDAVRKPGYDPLYGSDPGLQTHTLELVQAGARLWARESGAGLSPGGPVAASPLAYLRSGNRELSIAVLDAGDESQRFWECGEAPSWAQAWGWDAYGAWAQFSVQAADGGEVSQRLRWIEPGSFVMGSPQDEPERDPDEGPQHRVRFTEGFWLFETACTQALWQALMGENPSRFKGAGRPVERVSWDDAQRFVEALNGRVLGLAATLPSEAQWEYACRAGTTTPFSFGEDIDAEQVNYDGNYPYRGGKQGQYRQATVDVASLSANPWGLYEMHGNVWEWVQDPWHDDYECAPGDGSVWESTDTGAGRVARGGSWLAFARLCRCGYRYQYTPEYRYDSLGFRCARVQVPEPGKPSGSDAECASLARPGPRSGWGRAAPGPAGAPGQEPPTVVLRLDGAAAAATLPAAPAIEIRSDRERLTLHRLPRPEWASAMGRDRYGLWVEIAVAPATAEPTVPGRQGRKRTAAPPGTPGRDLEPIVQRLRWIPPGRFLMGSPEDEPGRRNAEGPQHQVTIGRGFWLFDTPCTQALWVTVMDDNPSRFKSPERPVEQVSWDDTQGFVARINERIPGLALTLPNEAQWEHACRAGTGTALYSGPIAILGLHNAPALDPIAWYGGNSGCAYDLDEGHPTTGEYWKEMQYETKRAGTRKVKGRQPNPWGLYDLLGNVFEWVADAWHPDYEGAPEDGSVWESSEAGAGRVIRGGSWGGGARDCRCAYRVQRTREGRDGLLGFRCALVQET
jgi:formylglycine-generating enzyme required for sulfatase activity